MSEKPRLLLLGSTGLLGRALGDMAIVRGHQSVGVARANAEICADITDEAVLQNILDKVRPDVVINAAANVDLAACEDDPKAAMQINAHLVHVLAKWSAFTAKPLIHISTDHLFDGDGARKHDEMAEITLCNAYARSKRVGETYALAAPKSLVVRTSIVGFHPDGRGLAHWACQAIEEQLPMTLFDDFFGSSIDTQCFARALFDLIEKQANGLLHVAASEVFSKQEFVMALARAMDVDLNWAETGSVAALVPRRANSLGLDVRRAEAMLGYSLPGLELVAQNLARQWKNQT